MKAKNVCRKTLHWYAGRQRKVGEDRKDTNPANYAQLLLLASLRISYNVDFSKRIISKVLRPQPFL